MTAKTTPFDEHPDRYDDWFDRHDAAYRSELRALRSLFPAEGDGLEIGVGTGRFAAPLGIEHGIDPSPAMRERARERGIQVRNGTAENLPYADEHFDSVLMTTTLCYLDASPQAFREALRVLRPEGAFVVGMIDADSPLGERYQCKQKKSTFYRNAHFHGASDVVRLFDSAGFEDLEIRQTLFSEPKTMTEADPVQEGHGEGGYVVLRGLKPPGT